MVFFPKIADFFQMPFLPEEPAEFIVKVIRESLANRKETKVRRNDFIDLILDALKNNERDEEAEKDQFEKDAEIGTDNSLGGMSEEDTEMHLISSAFQLFFAGRRLL